MAHLSSSAVERKKRRRERGEATSLVVYALGVCRTKQRRRRAQRERERTQEPGAYFLLSLI
jgi:hypothetical protein